MMAGTAAHSAGIQLSNLAPSPRPANRPSNSQPTHQYYDSFPTLCSKFRDLDTDGVYEECKAAVMNEATRNFIIDFGGAAEEGGAAWCTLDLDDSPATVEAVKGLLGKERPRELRTRWINIFSPHTQQPLVRAIAQHYGLSSRHTSALMASPQRVETVQKKPVQHQQQMLERLRNSLHRGRDVENAAQDTNEATRLAGGNVPPGRAGQGYMDLVSSVWHWHAVEWGGRFMCIGFNLLHQIPEEDEVSSAENGEDTDYEDEWEWSGDKDGKASMDKGENYPQGKRLWSWLVLCDDGTVIALHEPTGKVSVDQMKLIRKNMFTVFRSLSQSPKAQDEAKNSYDLNSGLEEMPFRRIHTKGDKREDVDSAPSLLFYYLFDDWYSSLGLVVGRGYPYSIHMSNLRQEMQRNPKLSHISRLHRLARQLATLKRMYETKKIIIDNVLYRQENSLSNRSSSQLQPPPTPPDPHDPAPTLGDPNILGVPLSPTAIAKFERLRDRVKLYALGEIEDCLAEKTELISMTFNLLAMRESQAVERLSRVAIFLTKFTFLFLPLTLITGYFSMQLKDMDDYTQAHFWAASGIFVALMILILYMVGKSTDTLETGVIWKSVKEMWFPCLGRKKKKKKGGKGGRRSY